jgi:apolipoprotein N-acyltransferase
MAEGRGVPVAARTVRPSWRFAAAAGGIAAWFAGLSGWRRGAAALLLGALASLAMPPLYAVAVLLIAIPGLIFLIDHSRGPLSALVIGWLFGFGHFVVGVYWVAESMLAVPSFFGWTLPLVIAVSVGGLAALLAPFPAFAAFLARTLWPAGPARVLVLAIAWALGEWLRGWVLSGFPWNLMAYSWAFSDAMNQFAALAGSWGLSFVTIAVAGLPALLIDWRGRPMPGLEGAVQRPARALAALAFGAVVLAAVWIGGTLRLAGVVDEAVPGVRLRLVQANVDPGEKGNTVQRAGILERHMRLTTQTPGFAEVTHVVWPETATLFLLEREPALRARLAEAAPAGGVLVTGVVRGEPQAGPLERVWNSLAAIDHTGALVASYDKFHLVPFGEYVPARGLLPFLSKFTPGAIDFSAGPGPRTLRLPGLPPVGPLICYEAIFPGQVVDRSDRPDWLLNLTNDGWFGTSSGPYQHFASARLRAVEEGLPLVRAANTGISGVVDPYGRVLAQTGLGETRVLDVALPRALSGLTPYARFGDGATAALLLIGALLAVALRRVA